MNRNSYFTIAILAGVLSMTVPAGLTSIDTPDDKVAIQKVIDASIGWAMNKDVDLLYRSVAQDAEFFIFHPDSKSTIVGFDAFKKLAEGSWLTEDFKAIRYEFRDIKISLSGSGEVAWFSALLDDCGEFKGKPGCWKDTRYTGVLEKRNGRWVICQMHFSFAADKVRAEVQKTATQREP